MIVCTNGGLFVWKGNILGSQQYKAVYFSDHPGETAKERTVTLAFGKSHTDIFQLVKPLSSDEIRRLLGTESFETLTELADAKNTSVNRYCISMISNAIRDTNPNTYQLRLPGAIEEKPTFDPISLTFRGGKKEPFSRWYPFIEGYSPNFVREVIQRFAPHATRLLDPFCGTGSSVVAASELGMQSFYCELNPVLQFTTKARLTARTLGADRKLEVADKLSRLQDALPEVEALEEDPNLRLAYYSCFKHSKFFAEKTFQMVLRLRTWIDGIGESDQFTASLACVAVLAALVPASRMKRAGDLRYRTDHETASGSQDLFELVRTNLGEISDDLRSDIGGLASEPILLSEDALTLANIPSLDIDVIVTSPPYVNGTNYFRNTKIELWFLRAIKSGTDLRRFRSLAVTSGINDVRATDTPHRMRSWVGAVVNELEGVAYDPRIPKMIASYFDDMERLFRGMQHHLVDDAIVAVDIGDSAYAGVHVPSDALLDRTMEVLGFAKKDEIRLRTRRSRGGMTLGQYLLVYEHPKANGRNQSGGLGSWQQGWSSFSAELPHQKKPYSMRNWGHRRHSLCSYQGKLKPAIAHHLVRVFVPEGGRVLDPFAGVGTIPFEAALQGRQAYGFEISPAAFYIARAKCSALEKSACAEVIVELSECLRSSEPTGDDRSAGDFGLNGRIKEYFHPKTLREVVMARRFFIEKPAKTKAETFVLSCLLHILHGNRPYALSRRSHPITPYKPSGEFKYMSLLASLQEKVDRTLAEDLPEHFNEAGIWLQDSTEWWPNDVQDLDAVITSPPFFDSTRFYMSNWMRLWFVGWEPRDFETRPLRFIDERQKRSFDVYKSIFQQARERLKSGGVLVLHLGKSEKCDMASELGGLAATWFTKYDILDESVAHLESHGIRDKGTVSSHQYLVLT